MAKITGKFDQGSSHFLHLHVLDCPLLYLQSVPIVDSVIQLMALKPLPDSLTRRLYSLCSSPNLPN